MKIILGKQIEGVKKKDSENEKNLLKNRSNELNEVDINFPSNSIKNIKLGTQLVNRIYLNNNIIYDLEKDTILLDNFHSLVPKTATSIIFDKLVYQDITNYNLVGYCDVNNHIAVYQNIQNNTEYLILNVRNAVIYAPDSCSLFLYDYTVLTHCVFHYFNTSNVVTMRTMFGNCSKLTSLDLSNFNTSTVNNMAYMFYRCSKLTSLDLSNFNTSEVTDMSEMFNNCKNLTSLDVSNFNTSKVTSMQRMFDYCSNLISLDVSNFKTSNVTSMCRLFAKCSNLTSLDVSNFDTSKVYMMFQMFQGCSNLTSLDVSNFNTPMVTDMGYMFADCSNLISLNLSNFNTSKVKNIGRMFADCSNLISLDLSNFDTSLVTEIGYMFYKCSKLKTIISNTFSKVSLPSTNVEMFYGCNLLVGGNGTTYSNSHTNTEYARVDGANGLPGYFTAPAT